jgi:hypothetical protein
VRVRVLLISLALVALAFAGFHQRDTPPVEQSISAAGSGELAGKPAPEAEPLAIIGAALGAAGAGQAKLLAASRQLPHPAGRVIVAHPTSAGVSGLDARPRTFPLLI